MKSNNRTAINFEAPSLTQPLTVADSKQSKFAFLGQQEEGPGLDNKDQSPYTNHRYETSKFGNQDEQ